MPSPLDRHVKFEVRLPSDHPQLLEGLDTWLRLGLMSDAQAKQLCREFLVCPVVLQPQTQAGGVAVATSNPRQKRLITSPQQGQELPPKPRKPSVITGILESLKAELSVRWLLFLGIFLVVMSSGVLAASQWESFPASLQYGVLLGYTLSFWGFSFWAGKQRNLRLTAQALLIVTLLLVPVNFWAMDSFGLWKSPFDWIAIAIAFVTLTKITVLLVSDRLFVANVPNGKLSLINILGLSYLHWGWKIPGFPLIAVYLAMAGTTIITVYHHRYRTLKSSTQSDRRIGLGITLPALVVFYALGVLLVRAIFVVRLDVTQLGLAIGICGWLVAWLAKPDTGIRATGVETGVEDKEDNEENVTSSFPSPPLPPSPPLLFPWELLGSILLFLGWLVSVVPYPGQAIAVSGLGLWFFIQRLQRYSLKRDFTGIFLIGLQGIWLGWRLVPAGLQVHAIAIATQLTYSHNQPWALLSVALFPYVIFLVALTDKLHGATKKELADFGQRLALAFGIFLTFISLVNPILRSLNLLLSTLTLAIVTYRDRETGTTGVGGKGDGCGATGVETRRRGDKGRRVWEGGQGDKENFSPTSPHLPLPPSPPPPIPPSSPLVYLTHITGILTICSTIDWLFPHLTQEVWATILLVLAVAEWQFSVSAGLWRRSGWYIGFGLAAPSYILLWMNASSAWNGISGGAQNWGLIWLIAPVALTIVASRTTASRRAIGTVSSVVALGLAQLLTLPLPGIRLISLAVATVVMVANTRYLKDISTAVITVGFGLSFIGALLWEGVPGLPRLLPQNWYLVGAIAIFSLWVTRTVLRRGNEFANIYAEAFDRWAIAFCGVELLSLTLHSVFIYQGFDKPGVLHLSAIAITLVAIVYRTWRQRADIGFYAIGWCLELLTAEVLGFGQRSVIRIAIANIALGLATQLFGEWWRRRHQLERLPNSWHILPIMYGVLGAMLRVNTFANWTGLSSLGIALIVIGVGRRRPQFKPLIYLGIFGISFSAYELLSYQLSQASGGAIGDGLIALSALGATIMYAYRILSPWLINYLCITAEELNIIAHLHWALSSCLLIGAIYTPIAINRLLGLGIGIFLIRYAIFQGKGLPQSPIARGWNITTGEIWVYLGLLEIAFMRIYWLKTAIGQFITGPLRPWNVAIACVFAYFLYILPWENWGWLKRPWQQAAYITPLIILWETRFEVYPISLLLTAGFYLFLAKAANKFWLTYISVALVHWALLGWFFELNFTDALWYVIPIGLSLLYAAQFDPYFKQEQTKKSRHFLRILGSGLICGWAIFFHQDTAWIPGIFSLIAIFAGLGLRVRAFLYVGTATFFITSIYQLVIFSLRYPFIKSVVSLVVGIILISIAANFETRREQLNSILRNISSEFQEWE